jgi:hypothetical protein
MRQSSQPRGSQLEKQPAPKTRRPSREVIHFIVLVIVVLLIMGSIYLWQNLVFTGQTRAIAGSPNHFLIQLGVSESDLNLVEEGLRLSDDYLKRQLGITLPQPIEVRMSSITPCIPFQDSSSGSTAIADKSSMCVNTRGYAWTKVVPQKRLVGLSIIAHEHFHNFQGQFGCLPSGDAHEYNWWVEGSATYVGWHTLVDAGMVTEADVIQTMRDWGGFASDLEPLANYERHMSGDAQYALAYRAIADLVKRTGSVKSLYAFCNAVGKGTNWRTAFESAYGIPVSDFYAQFEQERQE